MRECYPHGLRFCNERRSAPENVHFQGVKKGAAVLLTEELFSMIMMLKAAVSFLCEMPSITYIRVWGSNSSCLH